jgi:hypothetical protein
MTELLRHGLRRLPGARKWLVCDFGDVSLTVLTRLLPACRSPSGPGSRATSRASSRVSPRKTPPTLRNHSLWLMQCIRCWASRTSSRGSPTTSARPWASARASFSPASSASTLAYVACSGRNPAYLGHPILTDQCANGGWGPPTACCRSHLDRRRWREAAVHHAQVLRRTSTLSCWVYLDGDSHSNGIGYVTTTQPAGLQ